MNAYRVTLKCGVEVFVAAREARVGRLEISFAESRKADANVSAVFMTRDVAKVEDLGTGKTIYEEVAA